MTRNPLTLGQENAPLESGDGRDLTAAGALVRASWLRSRTTLQDPARARVMSILSGDELAERRAGHPLSPLLPLVHSLLAAPAQEHGLIMAVGDEQGRLLWVDGDSRTRSRAEDMAFLAGADWSETSMGTSAPGIAVATGNAVQVTREEHFSPLATSFSCTAVPLTDPRTGQRIGFLDLTGDDRAIDSLIMPYLRATASAVEAHLLSVPMTPAAPSEASRAAAPAGGPRTDTVGSGGAAGSTGPAGASGSASAAGAASAVGSAETGRRESIRISVPARPLLRITGPAAPALTGPRGTTRLSLRHAELLAVLSRAGAGLGAEQLAARVYPGAVTAVTLRAEMARLRRALASAGVQEDVRLESRPYRVTGLDVDAIQVAERVQHGEQRLALAAYAGEILPGSEAPEIVQWRQELAVTVRDTVLTDGDLETVLDYLTRVEAADDAEAWRVALRLLPPRSPRRAAVVAHLEVLEA